MRIAGLVLTLALSLELMAQPPAQQPDRISGTLDPARVVALKGNVHPLARPENDQGPVAPDMMLDYVTLHLKPTPAQQADLDQLLTDLQDPKSSHYRQWLTPEAYADRFGASPADLEQIAGWLQGQGLTVVTKARGRNFVVFKGAAAMVQAALHVEIHRFLVDGEMHFANVGEPSVPVAIQPFTIGFSGLDDFKLKSPTEEAQPLPAAVFQNQHVLGPPDLSVIYDTAPFYGIGVTGAGMKLAVMGQSDVNLSDIATYQATVGLPANAPVKLLVANSSYPGITSDSGESDLDLEMTDAIAPYAEIVFVYSTNVVYSVAYAIDQAVAPVISYSYAGCELGNSTAAVTNQQLAQQANTEGITWIASSGDYGAAACDPGASTASHPVSVMLPASIPEVTGVGGTQFNEGTGNYWGSNGYALSYIPEVAFNDTSAEGHLFASGGGMSTIFPRPVWQSAISITSSNARLVPDVAMSASLAHDPYFAVEGGLLLSVGGTSAAAPVFAGIVLLLNQYLGANGLGNINPGLYRLASTSANVCSTTAVTSKCVFHDITSGSNIVPCVAGTTGCVNGSMGYSAGPGYDMVTGLGSIDAANLALAAASGGTAPSISSVATAYGGTAIAQNAFIVIKGTNLVPVGTTPSTGVNWNSAPSFASGQMPTQLNTVTVTVNGKPAFVYFYCSSATYPGCTQDQLNVLTPLDNTVGPVKVMVTSATGTTSPFTVNMQAVSPSFLLISTAGYVTATHSNYSLVGPTSLYPGYSTPAAKGEEIEIYAVGFGLPSNTLTNGSAMQSGALPTLPVCTVGGLPASLAFAGLISPGLYQLNLTIPAGAPSGDNLLSCSYGGFSTPAGDLITVQ